MINANNWKSADDNAVKSRMFHLRLLAAMVPLLFAATFSTNAQSSASGSMDLDSLSLTPIAGTISWSSLGWSLGTVSTTLNSDGAFDQNFDFETSPGSATASASVPYASAGASATATSLDTSSISGHAGGSVLIPAGLNEAASVSGGFGNFGSLETTFTLSQATSVSLSAVITAAQAMQTDAGGQVLEDEVTFNLNVDGTNTLFYDNPLTLGPSAFFSTGANPTLSDSLNLGAGAHDLYIEVDDEQQVLETPDHGQTFLLLLGAWSSLAMVKAFCGRGSSSEQRV